MFKSRLKMCLFIVVNFYKDKDKDRSGGFMGNNQC